ncbi:fimbrial protein [Aquitalea pelogenes]|uniref:fimbrial protein n=1 Tax=Aquitalea pelogenes TaxID=1293573 RepID=UPI0009E688CC|nr:fimbrial protein [Aquitalea pelogenes]
MTSTRNKPKHPIKLQILNFLLSTLLIFFIIDNNAQAGSCSRTAINPVTINLPATINIATIPTNAPLITPISNWISLNTPTFTGCVINNLIYYYAISSYSPVGATYNDNGIIYDIYSYANGIGFILSVQNSTDPTSIPTPLRYRIPVTTQKISTAGDYSSLYRIRLIRYSAILPGVTTIPQMQISQARDSTLNTSLQQDVYLSASTLRVQTVSCSVNTVNISVQLPSVLPSQFSSTGSTAGSTPFNIVITCPSAVNVYMTMTDNSNPASTSNIITAASGSTAQGLGIQVRQNGVPVSLGADSSMAGNTNQFLIGSNITGSRTIPFTANYIRTAAVTVGTLKAVATFTMSYQ